MGKNKVNQGVKKKIPKEVSKFFAEIGRRNGRKLMEKYGSDYFRNIARKRRTFGRQRKPQPIDN